MTRMHTLRLGKEHTALTPNRTLLEPDRLPYSNIKDCESWNVTSGANCLTHNHIPSSCRKLLKALCRVAWLRIALHKEELHDLCRQISVVRILKSRRIRWTGHLVRMGTTNACRILVDFHYALCYKGKENVNMVEIGWTRSAHRKTRNITYWLTDFAWWKTKAWVWVVKNATREALSSGCFRNITFCFPHIGTQQACVTYSIFFIICMIEFEF
jgi:hypothetical protein